MPDVTTLALTTALERPARGRRQDYAHARSIPTRWMDNDVYGHVNNVVYYSYFDTAVNAALIERGLLEPRSGAIIGLVAETGCRFHTPIAFPDEITAMMRVAHMGRSSVRYELGLFRQEGEFAAAEGHFVHVYVDSATRRPTPLPEALRSFLTTLTMGPA
ncbi:MAG: acyl-CoA thioesterase [Actinomycetospora chiangmaiensis]|jgi:acyl-CoA thioester hydrolase|nr:acyl-CoA thioesterase [Actinomycetospora chiangmaiensis]